MRKKAWKASQLAKTPISDMVNMKQQRSIPTYLSKNVRIAKFEQLVIKSTLP
jgi:hypothetical protein